MVLIYMTANSLRMYTTVCIFDNLLNNKYIRYIRERERELELSDILLGL